MSTAVIPTYSGLGWPVKRIPIFKSGVQESLSGFEVRTAYRSYPRYQYDLQYDVLRQRTIGSTTYSEMFSFLDFFNSRSGALDSFLYDDPTDDVVTGQVLAVGDGVTTSFQLVRTYGSFIEPVLAPNLSNYQIYLNGVPTGIAYINGWGTTNPGSFGFGSPPASGVTISGDFHYYWPCRFLGDEMEIDEILDGYYEAKTVSWITLFS
jgi:uncharacterized protein (TIGR02217 family)